MTGDILERMEAALDALDEAERALGLARAAQGTKVAAKLQDDRDKARAALAGLATPDNLWSLVAVTRAAVNTMKAAPQREVTAQEEAEWTAP